MTMAPNRYLEILGAFDALVAHGRAVSNRLAGRRIEREEVRYADAIYTKLICHAISLRKLSPSLAESQLPELWDVSSASAVARSLIESFDALAYIGIHAVTESERRFRIMLWELHDQQRRLVMLARSRSSHRGVKDISARTATLKAALIAHPFYPSTGKDLQHKVSHGDAPAFHLSQKQLNAASGINHDYYTTAIMFLSQYVHTFPFALHQLMNFTPGEPEALHISSMPLQYSLGFLAKAIVGMVTIWPAGHVDTDDFTEGVLGKWLIIAEQGVSIAD